MAPETARPRRAAQAKSPADAKPAGAAIADANDSSDFLRGWNAALAAARDWHESRAKQALVLARRSRFPKTLEREAEVHRHSAELLLTLSPDDV